ncbi:hypothetical protein ACFL2H_12440 [Planctomycetota bacterium]
MRWPRRDSWLTAAQVSFAAIALFALAIWGAATFHPELEPGWQIAFQRYDCGHYAEIARNGYSYSDGSRSNVAFFPLFPLAIRVTHEASGLPYEACGALVSNIAFYVGMLYLVEYLRFIGVSTSGAWLYAIFPTTFFFHIPYSESMFVCLSTATLISIRTLKSPWQVCLLCGLLTALRPVGVAFIPIAAGYTLHRLGTHNKLIPLYAILSASGVLVYACFLYVTFGDALAFARTQQHWATRPHYGTFDKVMSLVSLEPIWATYVPGSYHYWRRFGNDIPILSFQFMNPLYFIFTMVLVVYGRWTKVISFGEFVTGAALLAIPYVTRGYEMTFNSQARFCTVVVPAFVTLASVMTIRPGMYFFCLILEASLFATYVYYYTLGRLYF